MTTSTRDRILDTATNLVLGRGYAATSLDQIVEQAGITKGAFFHYFKSKADLAEALVARFAAHDLDLLSSTFGRAERMSGDPLQQVLIVLGLFEEMFEAKDGPVSGCLFASYCYQNELMTEANLRVINGNFAQWRQAFADRFQRAAAARGVPSEVDLDSLADMATAVFEGAYILAKSQNQPAVLVQQLRHYRRYIELLFQTRH